MPACSLLEEPMMAIEIILLIAVLALVGLSLVLAYRRSVQQALFYRAIMRTISETAKGE
jgi:hypothetical protein